MASTNCDPFEKLSNDLIISQILERLLSDRWSLLRCVSKSWMMFIDLLQFQKNHQSIIWENISLFKFYNDLNQSCIHSTLSKICALKKGFPKMNDIQLCLSFVQNVNRQFLVTMAKKTRTDLLDLVDFRKIDIIDALLLIYHILFRSHDAKMKSYLEQKIFELHQIYVPISYHLTTKEDVDVMIFEIYNEVMFTRENFDQYALNATFKPDLVIDVVERYKRFCREITMEGYPNHCERLIETSCTGSGIDHIIKSQNIDLFMNVIKFYPELIHNSIFCHKVRASGWHDLLEKFVSINPDFQEIDSSDLPKVVKFFNAKTLESYFKFLKLNTKRGLIEQDVSLFIAKIDQICNDDNLIDVCKLFTLLLDISKC